MTPVHLHPPTGQSWPAVASEHFLRAARLPATLVPASGSASDAAVFVTGGTGFLGGHLLCALLRRTSLPIICLVRGDKVAGRSRLLARLAALGTAAPAGRVLVVAGDSTQPRLGLSSAAFARLAARVSAVFHLAARLDFRSSFDALRVTNVDAVQQVLSLASVGLAKRIIYVSSLSVLDVPTRYGETVTEATPLIDPEWLPLGYAQTKWAAEMLLDAARERGFEVTCLRPSWIVGEARRGIETDFISSLLRIFAATGATPDSPGALNLVPVSFVAEACALLGVSPAGMLPAKRSVFHLGSPEAVTSAGFAAAIAATGRQVARLPLADFLSRVALLLQQARSLELMIFRHIFLGSSSRPAIGLPYLEGRAPVFDSTASLRILQAAGLPPSRLDLQELARVCLHPAAP
jgi:thioester reductase-like protein